MPICGLCKKPYVVISNTHLRLHGWDVVSYKKKFGANGVGFSILVTNLSKNDPRYIRWIKSLKKRPPPWNKGYTKETHTSVAKISESFITKKIDNFSKWRELARKRGWIRAKYPSLKRDGDLAELVGVILGDGHIEKFPRTECLTISSNSEDKDLIVRYAKFVKKIFSKKPKIETLNRTNCTRIRIYQKFISQRLEVPTGNRGKIEIKIPEWILQNQSFMIRCLRGLYEAEGSFCVHKPTYTYKLLFTNKNQSLLDYVYDGLGKLGFHPHRGGYKIQLSRREEVYRCKDLLKFRNY